MTKRARARSSATAVRPEPAGFELFVHGLHEHTHPMERLSRAEAEHDRCGQRGKDQIVGRGMELQPATDQFRVAFAFGIRLDPDRVVELDADGRSRAVSSARRLHDVSITMRQQQKLACLE